MRNVRPITKILLFMLFVSHSLSAIAQTKSVIGHKPNWVLADAESPPTDCEIPNYEEDNSSNYDRNELPQISPVDQSTNNDCDSPTNQQMPIQGSSNNKPEQDAEVSIESGDITDGGANFIDTMIGQDQQAEIIKIEEDPVDQALTDKLNNLEKQAQECSNENFTSFATQAESLGSSLSATESQVCEAARSFDIAYKTRSRFLPPLDPSLLPSSLGLASSALSGENFEIAVKWYQKSLEILEKWTPNDSSLKNVELTKCLGGLCASYLRQSDGNRALPYAKQMYELAKSKFGAQSAQACWGAATLGECYRISGMEEQLKPLQDEIFDICLAKEGGLKRFQSLQPELPSPIELCSLNGNFEKQLLATTIANLRPVLSQDVPIRFWLPATKIPRGIIVCIHGMCLHSGSYSAIANGLQANGFLVVAVDVRGLGTWRNSFGQNYLNLAATLKDIETVVGRLHLLLPRTPIFLVGESMGGGIALHASARHPELLAGVISSVPGASRFQQARETIMVILNLPFGVNRPLNIGKNLLLRATGNPQLREFWNSDPLSRKMLSPKELISFQHFMSENEKYAVRLKSMPILVIQGMNDHLVKPPSTFKIYRRISSINKTLLKVNSGEHLTFELNQCSPAVLEQVLNWVNNNLR